MRGHIRKRGKSWVLVIYVGRDPQTGKPKQHWSTYRTRQEAEAAQAQLNVHLQGGGFLPNTRLRVGEYLEQWLKDDVSTNSDLAQTTRAIYKHAVRHHALPVLGYVPLARLSRQAIQAFIRAKLQEGLSAASVHQLYRVLHGALGQAVKLGHLARNPCEFVKPPRIQRSEMQVLDEEQVRIFLGEAKRSSRYYPLYLTAVLTGMRLGELLGLRWKDVDLPLNVASIQQILYRLGREQIFKPPKSQKSKRPVALPPVVVEELRRLKEWQEEQRRKRGICPSPDCKDRNCVRWHDQGLVFCQPIGRPLHGHNITQRDFRRLLKRAGLPRIRFHDLRHSHATHLLRQGVHPKIVQERLGHSTPAFTLAVYSHVLPGMQEQAARELAERLLGGALRVLVP